MHIARLTIKGFRGVNSADIPLGRHVVLVGPNNSGKTTTIEALALQDLDNHRLGVLQGLARSSRIVAAADAFQCLVDGHDTTDVMVWLDGAGQTRRLTLSMRTAQRGLLAAALAVREGRDIKGALIRSERTRNPTWNGQGFRLVEVHARNAGLVAWAIANDMAQRTGRIAILTPYTRNTLLREALVSVQTRTWPRQGGQTFGPFSFEWEMQDSEIANELLGRVHLPSRATFGSICVALGAIADHPPVSYAINRMDRLRRVCGLHEFTSEQVSEFVRDAVRNYARVGLLQHKRNVAMTIHRAKNREFQNVVILWPHSATGSPEHLRRLLYNAITRAVGHCTVIVFGQGRLSAPPFAPSAGSGA